MTFIFIAAKSDQVNNTVKDKEDKMPLWITTGVQCNPSMNCYECHKGKRLPVIWVG